MAEARRWRRVQCRAVNLLTRRRAQAYEVCLDLFHDPVQGDIGRRLRQPLETRLEHPCCLDDLTSPFFGAHRRHATWIVGSDCTWRGKLSRMERVHHFTGANDEEQAAQPLRREWACLSRDSGRAVLAGDVEIQLKKNVVTKCQFATLKSGGIRTSIPCGSR
jgi:hypothetical protein